MKKLTTLQIATALILGAENNRGNAGGAENQEEVIDEAFQIVQEADLTTRLRLDYCSSSRNLDNEKHLFSETTQLDAHIKFGDNVSITLRGRASDHQLSDGNTTESQLTEGYVTLHMPAADLRMGKQIVAWGRADAVNPTDILAPRDYTVSLPFQDDQRFGVPAAKVDYYPTSDYAITVFATPHVAPSVFPTPSSAPLFLQSDPPGEGAVALKLDRSGEIVDWSVSYFYGLAISPDIGITGAQSGARIFSAQYHHIDVLGADFATNWAGYGLRGEVAAVRTEDGSGSDPTVANSHVYWVIGGDRLYSEGVAVNLQLVGRIVKDFRDPQLLPDGNVRQAGVMNSIFSGQQDANSYGFTFRIDKKWFNERLSTEIFCLTYVTRRNGYIRPMVRYAINDQMDAHLGGELYFGNEETFFGQLKRNENVFAELRYTF